MKKKHEFTRKYTTIQKQFSDFVFIIRFQGVSVDLVCQASITASELRIGVVGGDIVAETTPTWIEILHQFQYRFEQNPTFNTSKFNPLFKQ